MRGRPGAGFRVALYFSNFVEFLSPMLLVYIVTRHLYGEEYNEEYGAKYDEYGETGEREARKE